MESWHPPSWSLPLIVAVLVIPTAGGFVVAGPALGLAVGTATAAALVILVVRLRHSGPLEVADVAGGGPVMVVALAPVEDPALCAEIARIADGRDVLVVAPAMSGTLARWLSDVDPARFDAQRNLALSVASLTAAGVPAEGRVGDGDVLQATSDALLVHGAGAVLFHLPPGPDGGLVDTVRERLDRPVIRLDGGAGEGGR
jgi:hypothetical protein